MTLFFADIEASTLLLQTLGAEYGAVLTRIRELVRAAISKHGGSEVDWAGDGVFLAFERARDALAAAADVQRALDAEQWPESAQVRMAIGIHTGEPMRADDRYVGLDVHVAAASARPRTAVRWSSRRRPATSPWTRARTSRSATSATIASSTFRRRRRSTSSSGLD